MSVCMTATGVKSVTMNDSSRSQVFQCMTPTRVKFVRITMTPAGVKYVSMQDSCRSQVSQCMTPAGVKYLHE